MAREGFELSNMDRALENTCPLCGAKPGEPCSDESDTEEEKVGWHTERVAPGSVRG